MNKAILALGVLACANVGCTGVTPISGGLFTSVQGPVSAGTSPTGSKQGTSECTAIVGVATGDCSIETAMKNGNITKVHHVDSKVSGVLGFYAKYVTVVYGE